MAGEIGSAHAHRLVRSAQRCWATFARDEALLLEHAKSLRFSDFHRSLTYWEQFADPDGVEREARASEEARSFHLSQTFEGTWVLDALVEMATRAATAPRDGKRPRPLFTALVDYPRFSGRIIELANGTVLTPGQLVPWLSEADIERVVFDGPSRVLDVGVRQRLFQGATHRAVEVRDRFCTGFACDEPAERCDVDHVRAYTDGGPTTQRNGCLACPGHHPGRRKRRPRPGPDPPG